MYQPNEKLLITKNINYNIDLVISFIYLKILRILRILRILVFYKLYINILLIIIFNYNIFMHDIVLIEFLLHNNLRRENTMKTL